MKMISIRKCIFLGMFLITGSVISQELGSETVVVVKPYTPSVNDAAKIKEVPVLNDSVGIQKKPVEYHIFSVPVASTFTPAKGRAANIERPRRVKIYDNYITLGFGNYTSVLAEFYSNLEINRTDNFGIFLFHNSAQGGIEGVPVEDKYYETDLNLNYSSRQRNYSWNTEFGVEHQLINWYGIEEQFMPDVSETWAPQQNYYSIYAGGELQFDESFLDRMNLNYRYFGDAYSSMEHHINFNPVLEIPIAGELFNTEVIVDFVTGKFERNYFTEEPINYGFLNLGLSSGILILRDDLSLDLGAAVFYSQDLENQEGGVYVYPQVELGYRVAGEYFVAYAGLDGELNQNTYYDFVQENPFVSPTLEIRPTSELYKGYIGAKGKLSNSVAYNLRGSYSAEDEKALFKANPLNTSGNSEEYTFGNSFMVVYDDVTTFSAFGELNFDVNQDFGLRLNAEYFTYNTTDELEAWNLPQYRASVIADLHPGEHWYAGANLYFVGERKDVLYTRNAFDTALFDVVSLNSYIDLNANLGYKFNEKLTIFVKGYNLLGKNYERWMDFPVLGTQVLAGATYKFDF